MSTHASTSDFDLQALFRALDAAREARGWTWAELTRAISAGGSRSASRVVASSTIRNIGSRSIAEADGVLSMVRWLGCTPESFVPNRPADAPAAPLPGVPEGMLLRVDTAKLYEAVDQRRVSRGLTWSQLASDARVPVSHMRTLARGGRTAFPYLMRLTAWLEQPAADFVHRSRKALQRDRRARSASS